MPFSHHSHSGQFCGHAKNTLREVVECAIEKRMRVFALTEHMPRDQEVDLYLEERDAGTSPQDLLTTFDAFYHEARRLQREFSSQITILVGMEMEWIRPSTRGLIESLRTKYDFDLVIGSVHHVHGIPIDIDRESYARAIAISQKTTADRSNEWLEQDEEALFIDYLDAQRSMLEVLKPPIVGHFDLIRLLSKAPNKSLMTSAEVWRRVKRNLELVCSYGGFLEINSSGLRKGLAEPYPSADICKSFAEMGGKFVLSDDSHGVGQVGHSYANAFKYLESLGIHWISSLKAGTTPGTISAIPASEALIKDLWDEPFFTACA